MFSSKNKVSLYIIFTSLVACILLYILEQSIGVNYFIKTTGKMALFVSIPLYYIKWIKREDIVQGLKIKRLRWKEVAIGMGAGFLFFAIILAAYTLLKQFIDLNSISAELQDTLKITPVNFIFIGMYIILGNSFLEEFFFRGYIFLNLYEEGKPLLAYIFSSLLFSLYHIIIFMTWFEPFTFVLALLGLFTVGLIFNWMDTKSNNFLNSWISHALADVAIILIGFRMFGII